MKLSGRLGSFTALVLSAALTGASLETVGCTLLDVPKNILGGLKRTDVEAATAAQKQAAVEEVPPSVKELAEIREVLHRMVAAGELTQNQAELKFLEERSRIMSQDRQLAQQRNIAAMEMFQQSLNSIRSTNCYSTGRGSASCYSY